MAAEVRIAVVPASRAARHTKLRRMDFMVLGKSGGSFAVRSGQQKRHGENRPKRGGPFRAFDLRACVSRPRKLPAGDPRIYVTMLSDLWGVPFRNLSPNRGHTRVTA